MEKQISHRAFVQKIIKAIIRELDEATTLSDVAKCETNHEHLFALIARYEGMPQFEDAFRSCRRLKNIIVWHKSLF